MTLKLYLDFLSQPCRALYITLKRYNIPFEEVVVQIHKGEHLTEEFRKKVSPFSKVPVISDNGFNLIESVGILRYLAKTRNLPESWYPQDAKRQAKVDEYLEWQHANTRLLCSLYFQRVFMFPKLFGKITPPDKLQPYIINVEDCLDKLEKFWITPKGYINSDHLTAADVWGACEIEQLKLGSIDPKNGRAKVAAWLDRVRDETNPYYDDAHRELNKVVEDEATAKTSN